MVLMCLVHRGLSGRDDHRVGCLVHLQVERESVTSSSAMLQPPLSTCLSAVGILDLLWPNSESKGEKFIKAGKLEWK